MSTSHSRAESSTSQYRPPPTPSSRSHHTTASGEKDLESVLGNEFDFDGPPEGEGVTEDGVHFVLLAEFHIELGSTLNVQYPYPTGADELVIAEMMLPDGAHQREDDWTVFYLGQSPATAVNPLLSHEQLEPAAGNDKRSSTVSSAISTTVSGEGGVSRSKALRGSHGGRLLYCLTCVRCREDPTMKRGASVKALAICSPNPYVQIYKPLVLLALEEYFKNPSQDVFVRLFEAANRISIEGMPALTRHEKILLRQTERRDLLQEKFYVEQGTELGSGTMETFEETEDSMASASINEAGSRVSSRNSGAIPGMRRKSSTGSSMAHVARPSLGGGKKRKKVPRDTREFHTEATLGHVTVPIKIPMTIFSEDVGDYSIKELVECFAQSGPFPAPYHPYLHTNGANTNPIILILNAMLAQKRVIFLAHNKPANAAARMVLATCAMVTGCGQVLRGFTDTAFPYGNLSTLDIVERFPGFCIGVCNPRFEQLTKTWDVLCDMETGRVIVNKELQGGSMGSIRSGRSSESSLSNSIVKVEEDPQAATPAAKMNPQSRSDCVDNHFMDEVMSALSSHRGEPYARQKFIDFMSRFVRLAAHQEYQQTGTSKIGYPSVPYKEGRLGSGAVFADETAKQREMWANSHRIDAWRRTSSYKLFAKDWARTIKESPIGFDAQHQVSRLRLAKNMSDSEAEAIFSAFAEGVTSYEQVVELLTYLPDHRGGLLPISNGLFHRWPGVREHAIDLLLNLQQYPVGRIAVATMNYFHRKTFLHLLERRDQAIAHQRNLSERVRANNHSPNLRGFESSPNTVQSLSSSNTPIGAMRA